MSLSLVSAGFAWPGGRRVLEEVGLELERGRILALLGPNGAGKSTLLGLASGRLRPDRGEALLDGRPLQAWGPAGVARRLALLPQFERIPFSYAVRDFVLLGRAPHVSFLAQPGPEDLAAASAALEELGLADFAERPVTELSGGELQLVRLARALAQEAGYLLLDEPTSMLDPAHALMVAKALRGLARGGRGILFTTHDLGLALNLADEALLLRDGGVVAAGPAARVLAPEPLSLAFGIPFGSAALPNPW